MKQLCAKVMLTVVVNHDYKETDIHVSTLIPAHGRDYHRSSRSREGRS